MNDQTRSLSVDGRAAMLSGGSTGISTMVAHKLLGERYNLWPVARKPKPMEANSWIGIS